MSLRIKSFTELSQGMMAALGAAKTGLTNFNAGSVIRTLLEVIAAVIAELYAYAAEMLTQVFPDTATGIWLVRWLRSVGLEPKEAVQTAGVLELIREVARPVSVTVAAGTMIRTQPDAAGLVLRYLTTEEVTLPAGATEVTVAVQAVEAGSNANIHAGTDLEFATPINGLSGVRIPGEETAWITTHGADAETEDSMRERYFLRWLELATGSNAAAYRSWALSVAGVSSAWVDDTFPRGGGTLDVYILAEDGLPSAALLADVQALIDERRPVCSDALVVAPTAVALGYTWSMTPVAGYDESALTLALEGVFEAWFGAGTENGWKLGVGKDVVLSRALYLAMGIEGVYAARCTAMTVQRGTDPEEEISPADVVIDPQEYPVLDGVSVSFTAPSYE